MEALTKIVQCYLPNLVAGKYKFDVRQEIKKGNSKLQEVQGSYEFGVDAARFSLNAGDIYSVYPPAMTTGQYTNHLPHIVFNRRTLPWERTIDGRVHQPLEDQSPLPWMALLLFDENESKEIKIEPRPLSQILSGLADITDLSLPTIHTANGSGNPKLMSWENEDQQCLTIDITKSQFENLVPSKLDLPYTAHSKRVEIIHKDKNGIEDVENTEGFFSVLVGNRVIRGDQTYTAVVVSLEGFYDQLDAAESLKDQVRLVVLSTWKFNNAGQSTFESLVHSLHTHKMTLEHLGRSKNADLAKAIKYGYTPMKHLMRNGAKNISWYRGPFVPFDQGRPTEYISYSGADAATYYDGDTGMLDVSLACAWELGKILALKNRGFTKAMADWNSSPVSSSGETTTKSYTKNELLHWITNTPVPEDNDLDQVIAYRPFTDEIRDFLSELALLKNVPLEYLIPEEKYLCDQNGVKNDLTVFHINMLWIFALLDGAVSLIRDIATDTTTQLKSIISTVYGSGTISGFLMHSKVVSGYRGIEIKAFNKSMNTSAEVEVGSDSLLTSVRFERITPSIFLGIFKGNVESLVVKQPYEGLHFGVNEVDGKRYKTVRNKNGNETTKSIVITNASELNDYGVIKPGKIAEQYRKEKVHDQFTAAEYAYQMIDSPIQVIININHN